MRIIGNEIWFDSTLVGHLVPSTHCYSTVVALLEDIPEGTLEWEQERADTEDADDKIAELKREIEGLEQENRRQFRQIQDLEDQILELRNRVADLGGEAE